ncbi:MAG: AI-2E family transporter [Chloroflexi bacterium]|nr:AI-2E family transporter [Chloroflexota bacterium]
MIRDPWLKALVIVMVLIASLYLVSMLWQALLQFSEIILLFLMAWLLAFVLEPVVLALQRATRMPRSAAVSLTYLWLLLALSAGVVLLVPVLSYQITEAANQFPGFVEALGVQLKALQAGLAERGIDVDLAHTLDYPDLARRAEALGPQMLSNALGIATGVATLLLEVTLVAILSFYFMLDGERIAHSVLAALPEQARGDAEYLFASVHQAFAGFLRSQLIQGLLNGIGTALIMAATGLDLVLLSSLASGLVMMVPFIGPPLALVLPVALAYFTKPQVLWLVLGLVLALQQVVVNVIAPRLVGSMVGLHPLLVFFAVLAGMKLAGAWGVVFGIPIMAVMVAMLSFYRTALEQRQQRAARAEARAGQPAAAATEALRRSKEEAAVP